MAANDYQSMAALNRLLSVHVRSLPMYLAEAEVYSRFGQDRAAAVLANIVADQKAMAGRITQLIEDRRGAIQLAPAQDRTALNFLEMDYLLPLMIEQQKRDITALELIIRFLADDAEGRALAEEALGSAKAHLEALEDAAKASATPSA